jgi:hypothetical protein
VTSPIDFFASFIIKNHAAAAADERHFFRNTDANTMVTHCIRTARLSAAAAAFREVFSSKVRMWRPGTTTERADLMNKSPTAFGA